MTQRFYGACLLVVMLVVCHAPAVSAHDSPIDHVERVVTIYVEGGKLHVIYQFRCEERQVMLQLQKMDKNSDGKISDDERDAYFKDVARQLCEELHVEVDGRELKLTSDVAVRLSPDLSQTYDLTAPLADLAVGTHTGTFGDDFSRTHPGPYRWSPRQINPNGIDVDALEAPSVGKLGPHPAMVVVNLRIVVHEPPKK